MTVEEVADDGSVKATRELPFAFSMILPAFRGIAPLRGIDGLVNPRGFVIVDKHQQNPKYPQRLLGRRLRRDPAGRPDAGAVRRAEDRLHDRIDGDRDRAQHRPDAARRKAELQGTWNAVCLADFGDSGIAFVAQPQIPPRNVNWSSSGKWVHAAKFGFEKYFLRKMRKGESEPFYETAALKMLGIDKLKAARTDDGALLR